MAPASPFVLAALLGPALASAQRPGPTFIFDASRCNTNWDSAANWEGNAVPASTSLVSFGASSRVAGTPLEPVNLLITSGTYSVGGFALPRSGAVITLARDGATIVMSNSEESPAAYFTGGQTDKPECAFGCSDNWRIGTDADALNPATVQTLPKATSIPGITHKVVVPYGYNPKMSAWGLNTVKQFGWYSSDGTLMWANTKSEIPAAFTVPEGRMLDLFFEQESKEAEYRCNGACLTLSRCLAWSGEVAADVNLPFEQAARIRTGAARSAARTMAGDLNVSTNPFSFGFGVSDLGWGTASPGCVNTLNTNFTVDTALLPLGSVVSGVIVTNDQPGMLMVVGTIAGPTFHRYHHREQLTASATYPFTAATFDAAEGRLFYAIFDSLANYFGDTADMSCIPGGVQGGLTTADIKAAAGLRQQSLTVFAGALSPQLDLPYLVDSANKGSLADALVAGLSGSNGILSLGRSGLMRPPSLTLVGTMDQRPQRRGSRSLAHLEMVNYDKAQALIRLDLEFEAYGRFANSYAQVAVKTLADVIIANQAIVWPAPQNCLSLPAGYNWTCVTDRINATVETAMAGPAGSECSVMGYQSDDCAAEATMYAAAEWDLMFMCGPLGDHIDGVSGCVDPMYSTSGALFASASEGAVAGQEAAITAANAGGDDDDGFIAGFSMLQVIAAAAGLLLLCVIIIAVVVLRGDGGDGEKKPRQAATVAFENPMYEQTAGMPGQDGLYDNGDGAAGGDLYDEPEIVTKANPTYNGDGDEGDTAGMYAESGAVAGGGYLDMNPDDADDDDDDGDEEESEEDSDEDDE